MRTFAGDLKASAEVLLPDLQLPGFSHIVSSWFASEGQRVVAGDRLLEVTVQDVTIDLVATATGTLCERCVHLDDEVTAGQILARIQAG
jgi:pyruvate/2-oxoglutarate dehydrogenase complex dihydrolipoamide acyltransferase (E2) component